MHLSIPSRIAGLSSLLARLVLFQLPALLVLFGSLQAPPEAQDRFVLGAVLEMILGLLLMLSPQAWRSGTGMPVIALYLTGLIWFWLAAADHSKHWYPQFAQAILLGVPLLLLAVQTLVDSGATDLRRARQLAQRLADRRDWPTDLDSCRYLPEVKALRDALHAEAAPALPLLRHARAQVRMAALAALEFRQVWRPGQADLVLQAARTDVEPAIRAAAVMALANLEDRVISDGLAQFLMDPDRSVRRAASEAVFWDGAHRWSRVRSVVQQALSQPAFAADGPLTPPGVTLPGTAVAELTTWSHDNSTLGGRASLTLAAHYRAALQESAEPNLVAFLRRVVVDPKSATLLRVELLAMLRESRLADAEMLRQLLDPAQPSTVRLIAAEALLEADTRNPDAIATLRDVARQPNRELALACASTVQRFLGVDFGLALHQPLPSPLSRQAAEVARKVKLWANEQAKNGSRAEVSQELPSLEGMLPPKPPSDRHHTPTAGLSPW